MWDSPGMRSDIFFEVSVAERARLVALVAGGKTAQKHVWRAWIILLTADRLGTVEIRRRTGKSKPTAWRWQRRFMEEGVDGRLYDKRRPPGILPLPAAVVERVVAMTLEDPPGEATHWTVGAMAGAVGISKRSVQCIWAARGLKPHRIKTFKLSNDPKSAYGLLT